MEPKLTKAEGFEADLRALPSHELMVLTLELIGLIKKRELRGSPLDELSHTGDLSDCLKVYFDLPEYEDKPRYRLVYRELEGRYNVVSVQAVSVGERKNLDAYLRALKNLGRN